MEDDQAEGDAVAECAPHHGWVEEEGQQAPEVVEEASPISVSAGRLKLVSGRKKIVSSRQVPVRMESIQKIQRQLGVTLTIRPANTR